MKTDISEKALELLIVRATTEHAERLDPAHQPGVFVAKAWYC
jgi:hypothetical protein